MLNGLFKPDKGRITMHVPANSTHRRLRRVGEIQRHAGVEPQFGDEGRAGLGGGGADRRLGHLL